MTLENSNSAIFIRTIYTLAAIVTCFAIPGCEEKNDERPNQEQAIYPEKKILPKDLSVADVRVQSWLKELEEKGLILNAKQKDSLVANPRSLQDRRIKIIQKYDALLFEISRKKRELKHSFQKGNNLVRDSVLLEAVAVIGAAVDRLIVPLWMGGRWDFNGVPGKKPDWERPVACGHFLQKVLTDAGFNIRKNKSTWLAYLDPESVVRTFLGNKPTSRVEVSGLMRQMEREGKGLYVMGVECGSGHVLLGKYGGGDDLLLSHAGPHPQGTSVNYDDGRKYFKKFCGDKMWTVRIGKSLAKKWLLDMPVVPYVKKIETD